MREQEMRMRIFRFLKARMRNMIMPATVGIGLSVGACNTAVKYGASWQEDAAVRTDVALEAATGSPDQAPPGPDQAAPGRDLVLADLREVQSGGEVTADVTPDTAGSMDLAPDQGRDSAAPADQAAPQDSTGIDGAKQDAIASIDGSDDLGSITVKYSTPVPDAGSDLGSITVKYGTPVPDAALDTGTVVALYTAQMPDAGLGVRYMAQMPGA